MPHLNPEEEKFREKSMPSTGNRGFAALAAGLSGLGQGMMSQNFRRSYNAGQGGLSDVYGISRMGKGINYMAQQKRIDYLKKLAQDALGHSDTELLERGIRGKENEDDGV